ncbi:MAG: metal-sulfur cluster assembly factor [Planctomycetota bacterium]|jgi:metal-sulfur cluster biosynthetic enzyme
MPLHEDTVREQLKKVIDPELFVNIVDLGLIYVVDVVEQPEQPEHYNVNIEMTMTSPMCPAGPQLVAQSKQYVSELPGVQDVNVKVVMDPPWTQDMMTEAARDQLGIF